MSAFLGWSAVGTANPASGQVERIMPGFCTNCGAPLGAVFCPRRGKGAQQSSRAGADVAHPRGEAPQQAQPPQPQPAATQPQLAPTQPASTPQPAPAPAPMQQAPA